MRGLSTAQPLTQHKAPLALSGHAHSSPAPLCRRCSVLARAQEAHGEITLLDYGAGNVRSVRNAIRKIGYTLKEVRLGWRLYLRLIRCSNSCAWAHVASALLAVHLPSIRAARAAKLCSSREQGAGPRSVATHRGGELPCT